MPLDMEKQQHVFAAVMGDRTVIRCTPLTIIQWHEATMIITYDHVDTCFHMAKNRFCEDGYAIDDLVEVEAAIDTALEELSEKASGT